MSSRIALEPCRAREGSAAVLSVSVIIAAALVTSFSAVSFTPSSAPGGLRRFKEGSLWQAGIGILALASVLLAANIQLGALR
jgi:hypothetical protein